MASSQHFLVMIIAACMAATSGADAHAGVHHDPMECPNECCVDAHFPIDCSRSPPCDPEDACPCFPQLPILLSGAEQPKFVNKLVNILDRDYIFKPDYNDHCCNDHYKISREPFIADLGVVDGAHHPLFTPMFGYASKNQSPTYPGRTFIVNSFKKTKVLWENKLIDRITRLPLPQLLYVPVDQTVHIAMPMDPPYPESGIPTVTHLHGGFTQFPSDGHPEAWITPYFAQVGPTFTKQEYTFSNNQDAMMLWYHDHALGYTRLNNYAGLLGAYIIRGEPENSLIKKNKIPSGPYEVPLVIVDKKFTSDGQMFFDYCDPESNPCEPQPSALPEFFGDFILVNGKAWPYLEVEPREYRLRLLNACDSRFLKVSLTPKGENGPISFYQIGTDQGLLNSPVKITELLLGPSQRADIVVDFCCYKGQTLILNNTANTPFPGGDPVDPHSTGLVMAFKVIKPYDHSRPKTHLPKKLRKQPIQRLEPTAPDRQVLLFESTDQFCRIFPLLGTPQLGGLLWDDPVTETPLLNSTEIWEIYNTTEDAHPIHLHSGNFQIIDRQYFTAKQDPATGALSNIKLLGDPIPPLPAEQQGLFDTVIVFPASEDSKGALGQRTRIIMNFTLPGNYVWHCHILSHEDNEMMRPLKIVKPK